MYNLLVCLPFDNTLPVLLCNHQQRIRLAVCCTVRTEIMYIQPFDDPALRPLVVYVDLDPVGHVEVDDGVAEFEGAPAGVEVDPVATVPGDIRELNQYRRHR